MINFAPGLFKFNLTVTGEFNFCFQFYTLKNLDGQRQSSSELVQLLVSEAESLRYTIETRSILCQDLKFKDRTNIAEEILLYLKALGATTITIVDIYTDHASGVSFRLESLILRLFRNLLFFLSPTLKTTCPWAHRQCFRSWLSPSKTLASNLSVKVQLFTLNPMSARQSATTMGNVTMGPIPASVIPFGWPHPLTRRPIVPG